MSRRYWIVLSFILALVLGLEVAVRLAQSARSRVRIINAGTTPIENLIVSYAGSRVSVGNLQPGETGYAHLSGGAKGKLDLAFTQKGNPMAGCQIADYDPRALGRDGLEQVIEIKADQVTRYMDDAEATTPLTRLRDRVRDWVSAELDVSKL
jgi:hypothetical protein